MLYLQCSIVSEAYNFTLSGEGSYTFEARNLFYIVGADEKAVPIYADAVEAHTAQVSGKLAVARRSVARRATFEGCSSSEQSSLVSAASAAQTYAANALACVHLKNLYDI